MGLSVVARVRGGRIGHHREVVQARNLPLRAHAAEAQARAAALAARTAEVSAEAERVLDLARSKQLRTSRVQQLTEEVAAERVGSARLNSMARVSAPNAATSPSSAAPIRG